MIINALFVLYIFALLDIIGIFEMKPSINRLLSGRYVKPNLVPFLNMDKVIGERYSQTIIMITHNEEIAQMADRIIRIEDGLVVSKEVV